MPKGGDIVVAFAHQAAARQSLHDGSERYDAASRKWFEQEVWTDAAKAEPMANVGDQPRLPAWVPERTPLRNCGDIDSGNRR